MIADRRPQTADGGPQVAGFTLLELILSITILAIVMSVSLFTFDVMTRSWRRGIAMTERLHQGDYVMDQLVMALRSAYYRNAGHGFWLEDHGSGPAAQDEICFAKIGHSLLGKQCPFSGSPHRVRFTVGNDAAGDTGAVVQGWRLEGQPEDFDSEQVEPELLSKNILGFDCLVKNKQKLEPDDARNPEWDEEWDYTNDVPTLVQVVLYVRGSGEDDEPLELRRLVVMPAGTQ